MSTKQNLPYNLASEQQQLSAYYLQQSTLIPMTTIGQVTFSSISSGTFYSTQTSYSGAYSNLGQSGMLQILQLVLASYEITANDFNYKLDQSGSTNYSVDTTNTNTYAITLTPAPTVLTAGMHVRFAITYGNTGASTLNINGLGAKPLVKSGNMPLVLGDMLAGAIIYVTFDGTSMQIIPNYVAQIAKYTGNAEVNITDGAGVNACPKINSTYILFAQDKAGPNFVLAMGYRGAASTTALFTTISSGTLSIGAGNTLGTQVINGTTTTSIVVYCICLPWSQNSWI